MENYGIVLILMAVVIGLSAWSEKIKIPYPVVLVIGGVILGCIPSMPPVEIDPEIVLLLFLPPLLYDAAFNISFKSFRNNLNTISTLAIGLVFLTAAGIAVLTYYIIPGMTWSLSFVLGSILAATDAVAAISITKNLGLSHTTTTILEGESLINDASALVAYRFAVAAVAGSGFVLWKAGLIFWLLIIGGVSIGIVMSKVLGFVLRSSRHSHLAVLSFLLLAPFVTYLIAEMAHVSGVIAVVTMGLGISRLSSRVFPDFIKTQSKTIWDIVGFLLNGLIFILLGLELPVVLKTIDNSLILPYIGYAFLITIVALLIRMVRIFMQRRNLERAYHSKKGKIAEDALLSIQECLIISWSGMRGIVSLAMAIGLPKFAESGVPFPMRSTIIFLATIVVLITIVGQGLILPVIVKRNTVNDQTR